MIRGAELHEFFAKIFSRESRRHPTESHPLQDVIESGDFTIDVSRQTVSLRGENLELSSEEFDVFLFLMNHPQRLITPQTVLTTSWTKNTPRETAFLRVLLSLRKKLGAAGAGKHYLRTEPWVVYRFNPTPSTTI